VVLSHGVGFGCRVVNCGFERASRSSKIHRCDVKVFDVVCFVESAGREHARSAAIDLGSGGPGERASLKLEGVGCFVDSTRPSVFEASKV
jgi:hypothetical protein